MAFTAQDVKTLRERTGGGMMDCKKALTEADGDMDKAVEILREKGLAAAAKKADRVAAEGIVVAISDDAKKVGVVLEVNAETDFVAKNDKFVSFVNDVAKTIIAENPSSVEDLLTKTIVGGSNTVEAELTEKISTIGENMKIRRFERMEGETVGYVHSGGTIGVLVNFETDLGAKDEFKAYARDIGMQIAAVTPQFLCKEEVPNETLEKEKEILKAQAINDGKSEEIAEKMVMGRINKYYKEICLLEQEFVKDDKKSIQAHTDAVAKELGGSIKIVKFVRFEKGEGIEKAEDNFAEEVASMTK